MLFRRRVNFLLNGLFKVVFGILCGLLIAAFLRRLLLPCSSLKGGLCCRSRPPSESPPPLGTNWVHSVPTSKRLVFIGVLTAQKYLDSRAAAILDTWARSVPGVVIFFSRANSETSLRDLPLVSLPGVDDAYPPQKKSFMMLKYMHDHFLNEFEWFMRVDDDVYLRGDKLEVFLRSVNSTIAQFIGQAGLGTKEEFGLLSLDNDDNYCMGGPGMILSRETLRRVVPNISACLKNLLSTHEDVEVGRCVRRFAGIPCTWAYEMQSIFYHNSSGQEAFTGNLKLREVVRATTLHPIKQTVNQYRIYDFFLRERALDARQQLHNKMRLWHELNTHLGEAAVDGPPVERATAFQKLSAQNRPSMNSFFPRQRDDLIPFEFFSRSFYSPVNMAPKRALAPQWKAAIEEVVLDAMTLINRHSRQRSRVIDFKEILYGYARLDPLHGVDFVLDMLLVYRKYRGRKMTVPVRRHAYMRMPFVGIRWVEDSDELAGPMPVQRQHEPFLNRLLGGGDAAQHERAVEEDSHTVHFILPLSGRLEVFKRFLENFEKVCLEPKEDVSLNIVLFQHDTEDRTAETIAAVKQLKTQYPAYELRVIPVQGPFSRGLALEVGASLLPDAALLFFVDVDIHWEPGFLQRLRRNVRRGSQVFFPIVFSQYDPQMVEDNNELLSVSSSAGYWRQFGFGIAALFNSDLRAVGGFDTSITGWGKEDVDFFSRLLLSNVTVFRAIDPDLFHIYHPVSCDSSLPPAQLLMCEGSKAASFASLQRLARELLTHRLPEYELPSPIDKQREGFVRR